MTTRSVEALVIGGGQAGLSAAYFLAQRGFVPHEEFVLLDANEAAGGAWQHRWRSLTIDAVHGVHALPGMELDAAAGDMPAREVVASYLERYERHLALPIERPVQVRRVENDHDRLLVHTDAGVWRTRAVLNATGTWTRPFLPTYPGLADFRGRLPRVPGGRCHPLGDRVPPRTRTSRTAPAPRSGRWHPDGGNPRERRSTDPSARLRTVGQHHRGQPGGTPSGP